MIDMIEPKKMRIVYMGTPEMSAEVLEVLLEEGFNVVALIAQEDKPVGRKGVLEAVPTKKVALQHNIPVFQPHRIRKEFAFVKGLKPDLILTMAYGQIIPHELLEIPAYGCLNLHGSILPKYRGAAPIQRAIWNGETETGVTLMEMVDEMDAGKMYAIEKCSISDSDTYSDLKEKIVDCCAKLIREQLPKYLQGELPGIEQDASKVTFANKILPKDEKLSLSESCHGFIRHVNALSDEPGGYVILDGLKLKLFRVRYANKQFQNPEGTLVIQKGVYLVLNDGTVEIESLQLEGKKRMDGKSFANGGQKYHQKIVH